MKKFALLNENDLIARANDPKFRAAVCRSHHKGSTSRLSQKSKEALIIAGSIMLAIVGLIALAAVSNTKPNPTPDVRIVAMGQFLLVTNRTTPAQWSEIVIYLNDEPPFTYKWQGKAPAQGETIRIPLNAFVKKDGERFDVFRKKVTQAWVGGSGYDYVGFTLR